ncbi:ead/Ea22-like family protein [Escherichia coli]
MSEINYQALREAAEKATCGEWSLKLEMADLMVMMH